MLKIKRDKIQRECISSQFLAHHIKRVEAFANDRSSNALQEIKSVVFDAIQLIEESCMTKRFDNTLFTYVKILNCYVEHSAVINEQPLVHRIENGSIFQGLAILIQNTQANIVLKAEVINLLVSLSQHDHRHTRTSA